MPWCTLQVATVRTGHVTTDWFQIGKGVRQGCILSPCLFNLYVEYIMRNAGLEEAQAGIKIAGRNINNLSICWLLLMPNWLLLVFSILVSANSIFFKVQSKILEYMLDSSLSIILYPTHQQTLLAWPSKYMQQNPITSQHFHSLLLWPKQP